MTPLRRKLLPWLWPAVIAMILALSLFGCVTGEKTQTLKIRPHVYETPNRWMPTDEIR